MLLCGKFPPVSERAWGDIGVFGAVVTYCLATFEPAQVWSAGVCELPSEVLALAMWLWKGSSLTSKVTFGVPLCSPRSRKLSPAPWPGCMGALPCKLGNAKVLF